ncbi:MAG: hypothetical protein KI792_03435 [Alphaproteobacteria bacterium]|nr:hypothetical protein [Alphaproteobacteria bacterium SS10]
MAASDDDNGWDDEDEAPVVADPYDDPDEWDDAEDLKTNDGSEFGIGGQGLETVALVLNDGDLPAQFLNGTAVSADSTGQEVMTAIIADSNEAAGYEAVARLGFTADNGRLVLAIDDDVVELQSFALDRHESPGDELQPGQQQFLMRMVDAEQTTWLMHVITPERQLGSLTGFMRTLAQQGEMEVLQPTIWQENAAETPELLAVRPETVSRVDVLPHPSGEGWAMVLEHHEDASHGYQFDRAADAIDAMNDVLQGLGRPVTRLNAFYHDLEDGRSRQFDLDEPDLDGTAEAPELPAVETVHFSAILGNAPDLPKVVGDVVLEPDWIKFNRPQPSASIEGTRAVVDQMIYPVGRSDPHPLDMGVAAPAEPPVAPKA